MTNDHGRPVQRWTSMPGPIDILDSHGDKGGAKNADEVLGCSRGGLTTKIHLLAAALGRPLRFLRMHAVDALNVGLA